MTVIKVKMIEIILKVNYIKNGLNIRCDLKKV